MGFAFQELESFSGGQANGVATFQRGNRPIEMWVPEMPARRITLVPTFSGSDQALWGRGDFFLEFRVAFDECGHTFEITPY